MPYIWDPTSKIVLFQKHGAAIRLPSTHRQTQRKFKLSSVKPRGVRNVREMESEREENTAISLENAGEQEGWKDGKLKRPNNLRNGGKCVGRRSAERVEVMTEMPLTCNSLRLVFHDSTSAASWSNIFERGEIDSFHEAAEGGLDGHHPFRSA